MRVLRKSPILTPHRSVRTSKALTAIWILSPFLFPLSLAVTRHTLNNSVIIPPSQMQFCDRSGKVRENPFCHRSKRGGRKHTGKKRKTEIAQGVVNILQCNVTTWSEHAKHYILTSDFDAALISETH